MAELAIVEARDANVHNGTCVMNEWDSVREAHRNAKRQKKEHKQEQKEKRHEEREERRREMEHVPKTYWDNWDQDRADDL